MNQDVQTRTQSGIHAGTAYRVEVVTGPNGCAVDGIQVSGHSYRQIFNTDLTKTVEEAFEQGHAIAKEMIDA